MSDEIITIEKLQDLYTRCASADAMRRALALQPDRGDLKSAIKYRIALDESVKLSNELDRAIGTFLKLNPGVDIDALFAEKGL